MRAIGTLALSLALAGGLRADDTEQFLDPSNWEGLMKYWKVGDGTIVGSTEPDGLKFNTFLCSKKVYGDFELSFEVRLKGAQANSGVQVRSEVFEPKTFAVKGPQCDIGQGFWGSLYGEHIGGMIQAAPAEKVKQVLKPGEFNRYAIRCAGRRVTITLNGETMVDGEFDKVPPKGIIAWQIHSGPAMEVTFRNIKFAELKK